MTNYLSNFKCYLGTKQRLSIFGREKEGKLEIFILKCNKKDQFEKEIAKEVYNFYINFPSNIKSIAYKGVTYHPEIILIPIEEGDSLKFTFIKFCNDNFYKKQETLIPMLQDYLFGKEEAIAIGEPRQLKY